MHLLTNDRQFDFFNGELVLIDKPLHWTSFDVVNKIRYALKRYLQVKNIKVGHAGTLDPLATGLLLICTGKATKQIERYTGMDKEYSGTMVLGASTPSYDLETEINETWQLEGISEADLREAATQLTGELEQIPPIYSAIKQEGKVLYKIARKGESAIIKSRKVFVSEFTLTEIRLPEINFRIKCSKGTYIRSLVHDFGKLLENGAYLSALERTAIGPYKLIDAFSLDDFISLLSREE